MPAEDLSDSRTNESRNQQEKRYSSKNNAETQHQPKYANLNFVQKSIFYRRKKIRTGNTGSDPGIRRGPDLNREILAESGLAIHRSTRLCHRGISSE